MSYFIKKDNIKLNKATSRLIMVCNGSNEGLPSNKKTNTAPNLNQPNNDINKENNDKIKNKTEVLSDKAHRRSRKYNQKLLKNLGVHETVLELLEIAFDKKSDKAMGDVMKSAHLFLHSFCYNNPVNQSLIHKHLPMFLNSRLMDAETVCAIYRDNPKLCSSVDRSVTQHFITCLEKHGKKLEYLNFLKVVVRSEIENGEEIVEENENKKNYVYHRKAQDMVMTGLMESEGDIVQFFIDATSIQNFLATMKKQIGPLELNSMLNFHINLVQLLAFCTEGKNVFTEIRCHSLLPLETIVTIATHPDCIVEVKSAYINFLTHCYIDTEVEVREVYSSNHMWLLVDSFCEDIHVLCQSDFHQVYDVFAAKCIVDYVCYVVTFSVSCYFSSSFSDQCSICHTSFINLLTSLVNLMSSRNISLKEKKAIETCLVTLIQFAKSRSLNIPDLLYGRISSSLKRISFSFKGQAPCQIAGNVDSNEDQFSEHVITTEAFMKVTAILECYLKTMIDAEVKGLVDALHKPEEFFEDVVTSEKNDTTSNSNNSKNSKKDIAKKAKIEAVSLNKKRNMRKMKVKCKNEFILRLIKHTEKLLDDKEERLCLNVLQSLKQMLVSEEESSNKKQIESKKKSEEEEGNDKEGETQWEQSLISINQHKFLYNTQCLLDERGAVRLAVDLMIHNFSDSTFYETLQLGVALLGGGNKKCQDSFYSYIKENSNSEKIMKVLSERIKEAQMEMKAKANFITNDIVSGKSSLYTYSVSYDENAAKLDGEPEMTSKLSFKESELATIRQSFDEIAAKDLDEILEEKKMEEMKDVKDYTLVIHDEHGNVVTEEVEEAKPESKDIFIEGTETEERKISNDKISASSKNDKKQNDGEKKRKYKIESQGNEKKFDVPMIKDCDQAEEDDKQIVDPMQMMSATLKLLQLLCENHNSKLQNFFRNQNNKVNYNLVAQTIDFLDCLCGGSAASLGLIGVFVNQTTVNLIIQTMKTLSKYCQGPCFDNQYEMLHHESNIFDITTTIIISDINPLMEFNLFVVLNLKNQACKLVLSMIESRQDDTIQLNIITCLPAKKMIEAIKKNYEGSWSKSKEATNDHKVKELYKKLGQNLFILASKLSKHNQEYSRFLAPKEHQNTVQDKPKANKSDGEVPKVSNTTTSKRRSAEQAQIASASEALNFYRARTTSIEIVKSDKTMEKVIFSIPEMCSYLTSTTKHSVQVSVERDEKGSKVPDFFKKHSMMMHEMAWQMKLRKRVVLSWVSRKLTFWKAVSFYLSVLLNVLVAGCYPFKDHIYKFETKLSYFLWFMPFLFLVVALLKKKLRFVSMLLMVARISCCYGIKATFFNTGLLNICNSLVCMISALGHSGALNKPFKKLICDPLFIYQSLHLLISICGTFIHEFSFSLLLLDIVYREETLMNVIQSVTRNGRSILLTTILAVILIYLFSIVGFIFFKDDFLVNVDVFVSEPVSCDLELIKVDVELNKSKKNTLQSILKEKMMFREETLKNSSNFLLEDLNQNETHTPMIENLDPTEPLCGKGFDRKTEVKKLESSRERHCDSLIMCIITVLNEGLRNGGGVGDVLRRPSSQEPLFLARTIYDLLFFFIIIIITLNLIFGVIIDTFADLRSEKQMKEEILKNTCFICGLERPCFDNTDVSFEDHCLIDHNMWSYLYFIVHLRITYVLDLCGIERYVHGLIQDDNLDWFPHLRTMSLLEDEDEKKTVNDLQLMSQQLRDINKAGSNLQTQFNEFKKGAVE